jgi:hypothetical protein
MKTMVGALAVLLLGACATGSPSDLLLLTDTDDAGTTTPDGSPVVIVGNGSSPSGATPSSTPSNTGASAGGATPPSNDTGDDAGTGDFGGSSYDAGFGGSGDDAGYGGGYDAGYGGGGYDAGYGGGSDPLCEGYADPYTTAECDCTASDQSECQPNGCYNGYWCDTTTDRCKAYPPSSCAE